jgi:hypothetical protein
MGLRAGSATVDQTLGLPTVSAPRFIVDVEVELPSNGTDLVRNTRVYRRLAAALPRGTDIMADVGQGLAHLRAWIPATSEGALGALHAVTLALNTAFEPEQTVRVSAGANRQDGSEKQSLS